MAFRMLLVAAMATAIAAFSAPASRAAAVNRGARVSMQFGNPFAKKEEAGVPKGWKKVPSSSRPGEFSYLQISTGKKFDRLPQSAASFYDDERDTVSKPAWSAFAKEKRDEQEYRSPQEAAGFAENGGDLANAGGALYLAFVPFLAFALFYAFGSAPNPYGGIGNF